MLILLFVAAPPRVSANESGVYAVAFFLKLGPGRPTPAEVLENFHLSGGAAPVQSFNSVKPLRALRLIGEPARGDYAAWLNENPDSPEALLDRYLVAVYTAAAQADDALASLRSDDDVLVAYELEAYAASTSTVAAPYWRAAMGTLSPAGVDGWATVGVADTGLSTPHAALADVPGLRRGGFREALSYDFGHTAVGSLDRSVDEVEAEPVLPTDTPCDKDGDGWIAPDLAGHGTHVAGLIVAQEASGVRGACPGCSLAMARIALLRCQADLVVRHQNNPAAFAPALRHLAKEGTQVVSQSYGSNAIVENDQCATHPNYPMCLLIAANVQRDILLVAASGNARDRIDFPARDPRVIALGGVDESLSFWDEDREGGDLLDGCPIPGSEEECGSNFNRIVNERRQDFVAPARDVMSTFPSALDWNDAVRCGDSHATAPAGGRLRNVHRHFHGDASRGRRRRADPLCEPAPAVRRGRYGGGASRRPAVA